MRTWEKLVIRSLYPHNCRQLIRCLQMRYGGCVWAGFGLAGFPIFPVSHPAHSCHPLRRVRNGKGWLPFAK
ncbi:hypothetical protein EJA71_22300 [Pseudomonas sp. PB106]|nr:hypothetical protein EJA71_22300 [Pseudomonas sp. PB106]